MNKMHTIQDVKQRIHELIQKEIVKCNKEIEEFEHKIRDNAIAYGGGGWCTQFEKAKKRREDFIEELQGLERAQGTAVILDEISIYSYSCPTCQIKVEFKYIHVMEIGKKGARHHHLVVNRIDTNLLQQAWYKAYEGHNRVKVFPLDDSGQYGDLAAYFIKYTDRHIQDAPEQRLQGKRWAASKNLVHPEPEYEYVTARSWYRCEAKAPAGYYVEKGSEEKGIVSPEYYGYGYYRYRLVQLE